MVGRLVSECVAFLEVTINVQHMQEYMLTWEPYRDMWEVDKDLFVERYEAQLPNAAQFDANIFRYTEVANSVELQETLAHVHFLLINTADLKRDIIDHCVLWQQKLSALLYSITEVAIRGVHEYITVNTEA